MISTKKLNLVCIGGGTGLPVVLKAIEKLGKRTAIVNMVDDGRSTGILRRRYNLPSVGDLRNSLVALAKDKEVARILNYRFEYGPLAPHTAGNIMMAADLLSRNDGPEALRESIKFLSRLLKVDGRVLPVADEPLDLVGETKKGNIVRGQIKVSHTRGIKRIWVEPEVNVSADVIRSLEEADFIIISPGSLYSSIIATLISGKLFQHVFSSKAKKIFIMNIMNERNETYRYKSSDYLRALELHFGNFRFDYIICALMLPNFANLKKFVKLQPEFVYKYTDNLIIEDVANIENPKIHDVRKLRKVIKDIIRTELN